MEEELGRLLVTTPVPDELEAQRRAWAVVRAAYAQREPVRRPLRRLRPVLVLAAAVAVLAAALSPPGRAVGDWLRDKVGEEEEPTRPALTGLPAPGALLVVSREGPWIVRRDGSKRLLGRYDDAGWSPGGLFVVVTRGQRLTAVEPDGDPRWSLTRGQRLLHPRWATSGLRIAYLAGRTLRVVDGNGTDDSPLAGGVARVAPAWRRDLDRHVLAYADRRGRVHVVDVDARRQLWSTSRGGPVRQLLWSAGDSLLVVRAGGQELYDSSGRRTRRIPGAALAAAFAPRAEAFAFITQRQGRALVRVVGPRSRPRTLFAGAGRLRDVAWSPNGRWLLVSWPAADQWLFLQLPGVGKVVTAEGIRREFDPGGAGPAPFPRVAGWCCAG